MNEDHRRSNIASDGTLEPTGGSSPDAGTRHGRTLRGRLQRAQSRRGWSRRLVVRSALGTLALPALPSAVSAAERRDVPLAGVAGTPVGTRRFVAIGNLLGFQTNQLFPEGGRRSESPTCEAVPTKLMRPLGDNRDRITLYRGLDHGLRGGHFAVHTFLSGVLHHEAKHRKNGNVSVDQFIADHVGTATRFASLTVGSEGGIHGGCQMAWTRSGVRVPPVTGPAELYRRLFISDSPEVARQRKASNHLQGSILDAIRCEAGALSKRINREDRDKLDQYFTSIRDVETRLNARRRWVDHPKPNAPFDSPADTNFVDDLPMLYDLIALALQTDSTRVATLEIGGSFLPQSLGIKDSYHSLSHHGKDRKNIAKLIKLETYQIEHFNRFITRLRSIRDGEGSLLDSTAVLFGSGMGDGNSHKNTDLPILMAGGDYGRGDYRDVTDEQSIKTPLCNLLLSVAQWMGVDADAFGNSTGTFA